MIVQAAVSVGGLFHFKASVRCRLLALSGHPTHSTPCLLSKGTADIAEFDVPSKDHFNRFAAASIRLRSECFLTSTLDLKMPRSTATSTFFCSATRSGFMSGSR
jgi:hypothetical protein